MCRCRCAAWLATRRVHLLASLSQASRPKCTAKSTRGRLPNTISSNRPSSSCVCEQLCRRSGFTAARARHALDCNTFWTNRLISKVIYDVKNGCSRLLPGLKSLLPGCSRVAPGFEILILHLFGLGLLFPASIALRFRFLSSLRSFHFNLGGHRWKPRF